PTPTPAPAHPGTADMNRPSRPYDESRTNEASAYLAASLLVGYRWPSNRRSPLAVTNTMPPGASQLSPAGGASPSKWLNSAHWSFRSAGCWIQLPLPYSSPELAGPARRVALCATGSNTTYW